MENLSALSDEFFMAEALKEAEKSKSENEVPVGAVITLNKKIIARGRNRREISKNAVSHAEIEAIENACKALGMWRLLGCELFVTLEPCAMCTGAIINSRISRVVFGTKDPKAGSCGSVVNLMQLPYNHKSEIKSGVLQKECAEILTDFFKKLRK